MKEADVKTVVEVSDRLPAEARSLPKKNGGGSKKSAAGTAKSAQVKKSAAMREKARTVSAEKIVRTVMAADEWSEPKKTATKSAEKAKKQTKRSKAKSGNEKVTPAAIYRKMIAFGKCYQVDKEQDFIEAARIYAEEAGLIDQIRDQIAEEGLTVLKTYKTGDVPVAHPLLSELPRHVESANKCLATIGNMIGERGARVEKAARDLDAFRLH